MNCVVYKNNDEYSGSKELSGTTCGGASGFFYLNYGDSICMDIDQPIILCDYFSIQGPCNPPVTPSNTPTVTQTPSVTATQTNTPTNTVTPTPPACNRIYIEFTQSGYTNQYYSYSPQSPAYVSTGGTPYFEYSCSTYNSDSYVVFTGETTGHALIYSPHLTTGFILWGLGAHGAVNDCGEGRNSLIIAAVWNTGFTYNGMVYPANGGSNNSLANLSYVGTCNNAPTPTPTKTPTQTNTPTPSVTIGLTPTQTPSNTQTNTPTPSVTSTLTPTTTPTLTVCPETNNCMEITVTGATEEFFPSIQYNNCYGTLINESFTTNGTRYRCVQFVMGVAQIFSYTGMPEPTIFGGNCNSFECPGGVVPLTPTPTPTVTQTQTPSTTIGATPSNTQTQTVTPTNTQTQTNTQTNTPTPSVTLTATTANLDITNGSLDISISSVYVNSVITTVTGGSLPNTTGNGTNLETTQVGVYTVEVNYSAGVAGQKITLTDSDSVSTCQNTNTGSNTLTFTGVKVATYQNVIIDAQDGTC